jgi:Zinc carboxypeptidase
VPRPVRLAVVVLALAAGAGLAAPAGRAGGVGAGSGPDLDLYRITAPPTAVARLGRAGFDVAATRPGGVTEIALGPSELARLTALGFHPTRWRDPRGRSVADLARAQAASGYMVWKRWDGLGGLHAEIDALAAAHPDLVRTEVIGRSVQGRDIVAVRVTADAGRVPDGARPAVLYLSLQHAREWISGEVTRRFLHSMVDTYGADPTTTKLLDTTELWFLLVANPDGYERTFEPGNRLWRKNTADNNGDGKIDVYDGVDPNRNLPDHWGATPEGSSDVPADQSYRGPAPASEPETKALIGLSTRLRFRFIVNYHSFGRRVLYPIGWQEQTPTADQSIYAALAGTAVNPAIPGYKPELAAALYPTNGETSSWAHANTATLAFTIELGEGVPGSGFVFPDNEALIEQEYEVNRPFALDVARSAADPSRPVSHLGNQVPSFLVDNFAVSYGDPQPVQATVLRRLGPVTVHWQVGNGPEHRAPAVEWPGGLRYGGTGTVWEHRVRGSVTGTRPGDSVRVWFSAGKETSDAFTYQVEPHRGTRLLVVVGGDHGRRAAARPTPAAPAGPDGSAAAARRLAPVVAALTANGVDADVYDVEAHGHVAPDHLGVLGHYEAVVWTADDAPRTDSTSPVPESVSRLANDEMLALRDYLNEGGRLLYMGRDAGRPYTEGDQYDPVADRPCVPDVASAAGLAPVGSDEGGNELGEGCVALSDEFFQYWLGAYENAPTGGSTPDSAIAPVDGVRAPFDGLGWAFAGTGVASGRNAAAYSATAETLGAAYPSLPGWTAARYRIDRPGRGGPDPSGAARHGTGTGAAVETRSTLLFGFGFEDIATPDQQATVMGRALSFLLPRR